ncbi:MAG: hypothetical protein IJY01_05255 [Clostridia bacterium]|nr:hypothetical protein [Clostridia bacterium]
MKKTRIFILTVAILLCAVFLASCGADIPEDELLLIERGAPKFKIVTAAGLTEEEYAEVERFIATLGELGIELDEPITDEDETLVGDCEIIFGKDIKFREGCAVTQRDIGEEGYCVKTVGNKIIVCGGSTEMFKTAVSLLLSEGLGITEDTQADKYMYLTAPRELNLLKTTDYKLEELTVNGVDIGEFVLSYTDNDTLSEAATLLRDAIHEYTGIILKNESELPEGTEAKHRIIIRISSNKSGAGFSVSVAGNDLMISCYSEKRFMLGFNDWLSSTVTSGSSKKLDIGSSKYEYDITYTYEEFGAKGDGRTDDFLAVLKAHQAANQEGIPIRIKTSASYYFGKSSHGKAIPIKTNVDFGRAVFIVDDGDVTPFDEAIRTRNVFEIVPSSNKMPYIVAGSKYTDAGFVLKTVGSGADAYNVYKNENDSPVLKKGATNFPMTFGGDVLLRIVNAVEKVYVRTGGNANAGADKEEMILVRSDGKIDPTTPVLWDYNGFTEIEVIPIDDTAITVKGGIFKTLANRLKTEAPEGFSTGDQYYYFGRGVYVARSNTVIEGLTHIIENEVVVEDGKPNDGGYPYRGWLDVRLCNNVLINNVKFQGHRWYKEDRADASGKPVTDSGTNMGTYEINAWTANNITWQNCTQLNSTTNSLFWGVMGSNFVKNLTFDNCNLSRFDAHQGVANATVKNSVIGQNINCIGSGDLKIINTKKLTNNTFVTLRTDYGSTWEGDVLLKDCTLVGHTSTKEDTPTKYNNNGSIFTMGYTKGHNFGYETYLFKNITIDNFTFDEHLTTRYLFRASSAPTLQADGVTWKNEDNFNSGMFTDPVNPYHAPESITIINQTEANSFKLCNKDGVFTELISGGKLVINDEKGRLTQN